jgi:hypothetical protein
MFTKEYVGVILTPFVGKKIRMNGNKTIPFCLETSMSSSFQIELDNMGIRFILKDNFYIKRDLGKVFSDAFHELDFFPFQMDSLLKEKIESKGTEAVVFQKLIEYMQKELTPQIAYTYYSMITSLRVDEKRFFINDVEFYITEY